MLFSPHFGIGVEERVVALGWSGVGRDLVRMSRCFPILFSVPSLFSPPLEIRVRALVEVVDPQSSSPAPNSIQFRVGYRRDGTRVQGDSCNQILRLMRRGEERSAHIRGPRPTDQQIIVLPSFPFRPSKPFLPSSVCAAAASSSCSPPPSVVLLPTYLLPSCGARVSDLFTLRRARQEGEAQRGSEEAHLKVAITATAAAAVHPPVRAHLILSLPSPSGWSPSPRPPREIRRNSLKKRLEPLRSRIDGMGRVATRRWRRAREGIRLIGYRERS